MIKKRFKTFFIITKASVIKPTGAVAQNGVNPGEWVSVFFNLSPSKTLNDVFNDLKSGSLRVGMHVQAFGGGGSEAFVNNAAPVVTITPPPVVAITRPPVVAVAPPPVVTTTPPVTTNVLVPNLIIQSNSPKKVSEPGLTLVLGVVAGKLVLRRRTKAIV